jgi:hypothetical protein
MAQVLRRELLEIGFVMFIMAILFCLAIIVGLFFAYI